MACARSIEPFTRHVWRFCGHVDPTDGVDVVEGVQGSLGDRISAIAGVDQKSVSTTERAGHCGTAATFSPCVSCVCAWLGLVW